MTFETGSLPTIASTGDSSNVGRTSATVSGSIDPNGLATNARFEFGLTTSYGRSSDEEPIGDGEDPVAVSHQLTGLKANATYHYRIVAVVDGNFVYGETGRSRPTR